METPPSIATLIASRRLSRRRFLQGAGVALAAGMLPSLATAMARREAVPEPLPLSYPGTLTFTEVARNRDATPRIAPGYSAAPLLAWGDPLLEDGAFNPATLTAESQEKRFGYNNDFIAYMPLSQGAEASAHGLLCVNHEYTNLRLMFPGLTKKTERQAATENMGRIEQQAQGFSVVEVKRGSEGWQVVPGSTYTRRVTATTPMQFSGPAAGSPRLQTLDDSSGRKVLGTLANCAGGVTPWGTVLTAEENFDGYFGGDGHGHPESAALQRYGIDGTGYYNWHRFDKRFDLAATPNEPNRFGWVVEYDPYDPQSVPVKRTALGRFKHECATTTLTPDGRVVVYSGDDEAFEYVYKFVSRNAIPSQMTMIYPPRRDYLDDGVLYVARFHEDGSGEWLPLVFGEGNLTPENGFHSQADVCIETRRAADLAGATPMDRPEDVEVNPVTGQLFIAMTKNHVPGESNRANRRRPNPYGHILEVTPPQVEGQPDHGATQFYWDVFLEGGNPAQVDHAAWYVAAPSEHGWLTNPDNLAFDVRGRIWICTDGQGESLGVNDGVFAADTTGPGRGIPRAFFTAPLGAEVCGPCFTPDGTTLFLSIQHPGDEPSESSFDAPSTRWPDMRNDMPPRPSVVAVTRDDGGVVGG